MFRKAIVLSLASAGWLGSVHAADVRFTGWSAGSSVNVTVADNGNPGLALANGQASMGVQAGGFNTLLSGAGALDGSFVSYCVDLGQYLSFNTTYSTQYSVGNAQSFYGTKYSDVLKLFSSSYGSATNTSREPSAGFQIALWEVLYENTGTYNLSSGGISFTNSAALDEAAGYLSAMSSFSGPNLDLQVLTSSTNQDVAFAAPVPEPGTYALMLAGLGAVGFVARRRRAR